MKRSFCHNKHTRANITLLSPLNQTYNDSTVPLVFTVNKPLTWASYSLDGRQNITVTGNDTISNTSNGLHNLTVYANDTFGNIGASDRVNFLVAKPEPRVLSTTTVAAISGATSLMVGAGFVIYIKKHKR